MSSIKLCITPDEALVDERLLIQVKGLLPLQRVTIKASMKEGALDFISHGCFTADNKGNVDVTKQRSTGGTYTGVHAMGLIWSMSPGSGQEKRSLYKKKDVTTPAVVDFTLWNSHFDSKDLLSNESKLLAKCQVKRWYKAKDVNRKLIKTGSVRGVLFTPPGTGPFPGVIDILGIMSGLMEYRAALLASRGFTVFSMPLFGYDDQSKSPASITLEYLTESVDWFSGLSSVLPGGIGVLGTSKGGEIGHLLAFHSPKVKAVVKINGPCFIFHHPLRSKVVTIPVATYDKSKSVTTSEGSVIKDIYDPKDTDYIQAWKKDVPFLSILGEDDLCLSPEYNMHYYNMIPEEKKKFYTIVKYKGAGHFIDPPYAPHSRTSYDKLFGGYYVWGGNTVEHSIAQEDAWLKTQAFFKRHLTNNRNYAKNKL